MALIRSRRAFIGDLGKGVAGAVILTACSPESATPASSATASPTSAESPASATIVQPGTSEPTTSTTAASAMTSSEPATWARTDLAFVSAYVLVRAGEAVIVDTGVPGSEDAIEETLGSLNLVWDDVGHVIVTHEHRDHAGSLQQVLERAASAVGYAADPDIRAITTPRPLSEVTDGDMVLGLRIVATPGHTPGHISVLDPGRILLTGDAINNNPGLSGPNAEFTSDMATAIESARLLGTFDYEVALFGHGEPIESNASAQVATMAESL
jgi:glyoxylase-like metal-dependent hydrolase (beta-lactamase superfamily II)